MDQKKKKNKLRKRKGRKKALIFHSFRVSQLSTTITKISVMINLKRGKVCFLFTVLKISVYGELVEKQEREGRGRVPQFPGGSFPVT
jgi:hypothetical protein